MPKDDNWGAFQPTPVVVECLDGGAVTAVACGFRQSFAAQCAKPAISSDFASMLGNEDFSDVAFVCEGTRIPGHRNILAARSDYFSACFRSQMKEGTQASGSLEIKVEDVGHAEFFEMLRWLYTGIVAPEVTADVNATLALLLVADRYSVGPLKHHLTPLVTSQVTIDNVLSVLETADRLHTCQLRRHCIDFILMHFQQVKAATQCFAELITTENRHLLCLVLQYLSSPMQMLTTPPPPDFEPQSAPRNGD